MKSSQASQLLGVDLVRIAIRPGKHQTLDRGMRSMPPVDKAEKLEASVRAKVKHPLRVIKCRFGCTKVRCGGYFQ